MCACVCVCFCVVTKKERSFLTPPPPFSCRVPEIFNRDCTIFGFVLSLLRSLCNGVSAQRVWYRCVQNKTPGGSANFTAVILGTIYFSSHTIWHYQDSVQYICTIWASMNSTAILASCASRKQGQATSSQVSFRYWSTILSNCLHPHALLSEFVSLLFLLFSSLSSEVSDSLTHALVWRMGGKRGWKRREESHFVDRDSDLHPVRGMG